MAGLLLPAALLVSTLRTACATATEPGYICPAGCQTSFPPNVVVNADVGVATCRNGGISLKYGLGTRSFKETKLGLPEGRSASSWVDYNLYGHQVVCHEVQGYNAAASANAVDGDPVPVPHFGLALNVPQFHDLASRLKQAGIEFVIEPHLRFQGQPGEQWTMFFKDSSSNALEFKAMTHPENLFARYRVDE